MRPSRLQDHPPQREEQWENHAWPLVSGKDLSAPHWVRVNEVAPHCQDQPRHFTMTLSFVFDRDWPFALPAHSGKDSRTGLLGMLHG